MAKNNCDKKKKMDDDGVSPESPSKKRKMEHPASRKPLTHPSGRKSVYEEARKAIQQVQTEAAKAGNHIANCAGCCPTPTLGLANIVGGLPATLATREIKSFSIAGK